jgi:hypothetical protein
MSSVGQRLAGRTFNENDSGVGCPPHRRIISRVRNQITETEEIVFECRGGASRSFLALISPFRHAIPPTFANLLE